MAHQPFLLLLRKARSAGAELRSNHGTGMTWTWTRDHRCTYPYTKPLAKSILFPSLSGHVPPIIPQRKERSAGAKVRWKYRTGLTSLRPFGMQDFLAFENGSFSQNAKKHDLMRFKKEQFRHMLFWTPVQQGNLDHSQGYRLQTEVHIQAGSDWTPKIVSPTNDERNSQPICTNLVS